MQLRTCYGTCTRDVAASYWPAVEAATTKFPLDVAASLQPAVAAAAIMSFLDVAASLEPAVEAAANCPLHSLIRPTIHCRAIVTCDLWSSGKLGSRLQCWRTLVFFDFFIPSQLGEQVATCTFSSTNCSRREVVQEVPVGRGVARDESEHEPECLTLRSTSMSLSSLRRTAFGPGCVKRSRRHKRTVTPMKGVVSATVPRFCGID